MLGCLARWMIRCMQALSIAPLPIDHRGHPVQMLAGMEAIDHLIDLRAWSAEMGAHLGPDPARPIAQEHYLAHLGVDPARQAYRQQHRRGAAVLRYQVGLVIVAR